MFSKRLVKLREEKSFTKKKVAEFLKIDQSTYGKYELGKREPDYATLLKLADFFEVSTDYLLGRSEMSIPYEKIENHSVDISGLPEEAVKQIQDYVELVKFKYNPDKNK